MKWYLNSAYGNYLHKHKFFTKKLKELSCKNMLVIAHQSTKTADRALEIILESEPSILEVVNVTVFDPYKYNKGEYKIVDFDAVYVKGGLFENWDLLILAPCGPKFYPDLKKFLFKKNGCYFGSSLGTYILFDEFETNPESGENEPPSYWYDHGMGIFKNITLDSHYSPPQNLKMLHDRQIENLKKHPQLKFGVQFSSDCVLEIDSERPMEWKILSGRYEVNKYYPEL